MAGPRYFLTQITRTTAVLASDDPLAALTPLALRNSRTLSAGTSTACAAGVAFAGPATTAGFNSARPANLPSASSAAAPGKAERRWRRQRGIATAADRRRLTP